MRSNDSRRVMVTGAAGFVGANLCHRLAVDRHDVHAVVAPSSTAWRLDGDNAITRHVADVCDAGAMRSLVKKVRPSVIYHLATHGAYPFQTDVDRVLLTNILGLSNLLSACEEIDYELFVHAGSSSEYGHKEHAMAECDLLEPDSIYAVAKASQSLLCQYWAVAKKRPIVVLRLFSVYGPFEEPTRLIPRLMFAILNDEPLQMTAPDTARDFVYVDDVVEAFSRIDVLRNLSGEIVNLGTGVQQRLDNVIEIAERIAGRQLRIEWNSMEPRPWDSPAWVADVTKLRRLNGYVPATPLARGLEKSLEWFRTHRQFYVPVSRTRA